MKLHLALAAACSESSVSPLIGSSLFGSRVLRHGVELDWMKDEARRCLLMCWAIAARVLLNEELGSGAAPRADEASSCAALVGCCCCCLVLIVLSKCEPLPGLFRPTPAAAAFSPPLSLSDRDMRDVSRLPLWERTKASGLRGGDGVACMLTISGDPGGSDVDLALTNECPAKGDPGPGVDPPEVDVEVLKLLRALSWVTSATAFSADAALWARVRSPRRSRLASMLLCVRYRDPCVTRGLPGPLRDAQPTRADLESAGSPGADWDPWHCASPHSPAIASWESSSESESGPVSSHAVADACRGLRGTAAAEGGGGARAWAMLEQELCRRGRWARLPNESSGSGVPLLLLLPLVDGCSCSPLLIMLAETEKRRTERVPTRPMPALLLLLLLLLPRYSSSSPRRTT